MTHILYVLIMTHLPRILTMTHLPLALVTCTSAHLMILAWMLFDALHCAGVNFKVVRYAVTKTDKEMLKIDVGMKCFT